jgi:hypothetical protein
MGSQGTTPTLHTHAESRLCVTMQCTCRCDTCKLKGYCSSICAAAHMFDHECFEAPKPWLKPPAGPKQPAPAELGEEGLFGFIPWNIVRYGLLLTLSYSLYFGLRAFAYFRCALPCKNLAIRGVPSRP